MKVAYVHDWLITYAGAEKVLDTMLEVFPASCIYTLFYNPENFKNSKISEFEVQASFLNSINGIHRFYRNLLPLMPVLMEYFDLGDYDIVISSSHSVAKGVLTFPNQKHICYFHTPMRYAWDLTFEYLRSLPNFARFLAHIILHYIRIWDYYSSVRIDVFLANSRSVANRIKRYYGRDSIVVYPPVDVDRFFVSEKREDYFITVSRLVPYKRVDMIVEAFNSLGMRLLVVGDGPEMKKIKSIAKKNVEILGWVKEGELVEILSRARGFIYAAHEDFGIAVVEAMASGVPVLSFGKGGAVETVVEGKTGLFFYEQSPEAIKEVVSRFLRNEDGFDRGIIRQHALKFSKERFKQEFKEIVERQL